jgi:hypothetical protein
MCYIGAIYNQYASCSPVFKQGISCLESRDIELASQCFYTAFSSVNPQHPDYLRYASYYGFAKVLCGDQDGLNLCRMAVLNASRDADLFLNLARAEWYRGNRKNTVHALDRGMQIDQRHEGLHLMWQRIGERRSKPVFFLPRGNIFNKLIGMCLRA